MNYNIKYSVECLLGIERAILSSLITDNGKEKIEESLKIIEANDFYYDQHGVIFETIIKLYQNDQIINEHTIFLENQTKINEQYYVDVIATTPLDSIADSVKKLKEYSLQRQITAVAAKIKEGDFNQICKLQDLQEKFENINSVRNLKKIDDKFEKLINSFDLDVEKIRNKKIEYLYNNFIIKNDITMIVSRPGLGKSLITVALCNELLLENKVKKVMYLDGDNSAITIKTRDIHLLKEKYGNKLNYLLEIPSVKLHEIISKMKRIDLTDTLIVFDSVKNFIIGDRNNHKDVTEFMSILKELRNNGASVIFLHHQNKMNKEFNSAFAGSSAFLEDIALAFEFKKNEDNQTYIFNPIKDRNNVSQSIAFKYNQNNIVTKVDFKFAMETNEDLVIRDLIVEFLKNSEINPIYTDILKYLTESGYNKDKSNKIIQDGKDIYWKTTRVLQENNKLIFELIHSQDNSDNQDKSNNKDSK